MSVLNTDVRLEGVLYSAKDVVKLHLRSLSGKALPSWEPGSHIDIELARGVVRQYSLLPHAYGAGSYLVAVKKSSLSRGGSTRVHETLRVGDHLKIGNPKNLFALHDGGAHSVFIAGGIGITPIYSMAQHQASRQGSWELHYAARSAGCAALADEVQALPGSVNFYYSDEGCRLALDRLVRSAPHHSHFYCCGPQAMLDDFRVATAHVAPERVHVEHFSAEQEAATAGGFEVHLQRSGRTLQVAPGESILDAVLAAGIDCNYACMQGTCGSCEVQVLEGVPDHRDSVLSPAQKASGKTMLICCSGSVSKSLSLNI